MQVNAADYGHQFPVFCRQWKFATLGSPWENGYCESFNGKLRDELLNGELLYTLREAQVLIEQCGSTTTRFDRTAHSDIGLQPQTHRCRKRKYPIN
jgi:transposase InsO family protein